MENIHVDPRKQELLEARFLGARNQGLLGDVKVTENNFVAQKQSFPSLAVAPHTTASSQPAHQASQQDNSNLSSGGASIDREDGEGPGLQTPEKGSKPAERKRKRKSAVETGDALAVAVKTTRAETNGKKINEYFKNQSPSRGHQSAGAKSPSPQGYANYVATSPGSSSNSIADINMAFAARSLSSPAMGPVSHKTIQVCQLVCRFSVTRRYHLEPAVVCVHQLLK